MVAKSTRSTKLANVGNHELLEFLEDRKANNRAAEGVALERTEAAVKGLRDNVAKGIRPTTDEAKLNQTEKRYLVWLEKQRNLWIGVQSITFKLGHDCRYTPDFVVLDECGLRCIDTKGGHIWEDALIKMRLAARLFPWVRFVIAQDNGEVFNHKDIKP
jgi:hypothetical protein